MATIQSDLRDPPSLTTGAEIIKQIWGRELDTDDLELYSSYFKYYGTECERLRLGEFPSAFHDARLAARTHQDIVQIISALSIKTRKRPEVRAVLQSIFPRADILSLNRSIDFALRVWLMLNIREECLHTPRTSIIQWNDTITLADFMTHTFPCHTPSGTTIHFDMSFTAASLTGILNLKIQWTQCLADHLRFDAGSKILRIYPFKRILLDHFSSYDLANARKYGYQSLIPRSVIKETIMTLNLLFPRWDPAIHREMRQHDEIWSQLCIDDPENDSTPLTLDDFQHWGRRLFQLHELYSSPPTRLAQLWADRRNPIQWMSLWVAVGLTLLFGIISSITGIIQVWISYQSLKLAREQPAICR